MTRRGARKRILELLFEMDLGKASAEEILLKLPQGQSADKGEEGFVSQAVREILSHLPELDPFIDSFSPEWPLRRMGAADRNALRIACYELLYREDIPLAVSINEAVVLAKKFGGEQSGKFVNGILGAISRSDRLREVAHPCPGNTAAESGAACEQNN
jgi:N utilization substance protein B